MTDPLMDHLEFVGGCMDDAVFGEPEPEAEVLDRLDVALAEAWEMLRHTNVGQIK